MMYNHKEIEEEVAKFWKSQDTEIKKSLQYNPKKKLFSFLEGPPTANAPPALHHVEVRVFKDLFCRFKHMQGFTVPRKGGWDCHGLPVEVQIEKQLKLNSKKDILDYGIEKFNKKAKESVFKYIDDWNKMTEKMAYWIDLEHPYITLDNNYIESVWWSLKQLYDKKMLYLGHKVVPFCPRCETPLSSHEVALGYKDTTEDTVIVKLKVKNNLHQYFLAWTTTPWTLPSNLALAVHPDIDYAIVRYKEKEYILAKELVEKYFEEPKIIKVMKGSRLKDMQYEPLFPYFKELKNAFKVILADFVTTTEGTGIVHMAPAFGEEDYEICKKNNIAFVQPITETGHFTSKVKDFFQMFVKDADPKIIEYLDKNNLLFKKEKYTHTYPFCWRCDSPLIYYAMLSWFIKVSSIRDELLKNNKKINWYPPHIKDGRFGNWLEGAKDWALSRKKFWGTPLPIWQCKSCKNEIAIGSVEELKQKSGISKDIDLHKPSIDEIKIKCKCGELMERVPDVIDCWYDSGSAPFAQHHYPFENKDFFKKAYPYDFIAEAIDQTRGWFYTLHVLGTLLFKDVAYKNVVCAGLLVDEKGEKMSKSKGNILDPWKMFDELGVDAVRLQFCTTSPGEEKKFSTNIIKESILPFFRILWNVYIYTNNLKQKPSSKNLELEDKWLISRTNTVINEVTESLEKHNYHHCTSKIIQFLNEDISRTYIQFIRDREDSPQVLYTLRYALENLLKLMAPFIPYISEYLNIKLFEAKDSIHLSSWPKQDEKLISTELEKNMEHTKIIIQNILAERERAQIGVRWPLQKANIQTEEKIEEFSDLIKKQTNVKELQFKKGALNIQLDTKLTPKLEAEGFSREITRRVQALRKKAKLQKQDKIDLEIVDKNNIIKLFEKEIKEKTGASTIKISTKPIKQHEFSSKDKIKEKEFEIYLTKK